MSITARHYATGRPIAVEVAAGRIAAVTPANDAPGLPWVAPAFFDVQINGALGTDFGAPTLTPAGVRTVADECRRHGIGAFLPTIITGAFDAVRHGFATIAAACDADAELNRRLPGFHLEGPYLSAEDGPRGSHPRQHIRDPDWDEFRRWQDAAGGRIRMVTLAPERAGAVPFVEKLTAVGVVVAIGHTAATGDEIRAAVVAGARVSTHLGNGCHATLPRHPNVIWDQLAEDGLWASVIPDGHHLPASLVKTVVRAKTPARVVITCDASSLAGLPPGRYPLWGTTFEVLAGGRVVVPGTPYLAGSGVFTDTCVGVAARQAGLSLADAVDLATARPRELMRLPVPTIDVGQPADLVVFDWQPGGDMVVRQVV